MWFGHISVMRTNSSSNRMSIVVLHKILYYFGFNTFRQTFGKHSAVSVMWISKSSVRLKISAKKLKQIDRPILSLVKLHAIQHLFRYLNLSVMWISKSSVRFKISTKKLKQFDQLILSLVTLHAIQYYFGIKTFRSCESAKFRLGLKFRQKN